MKKFQTLLLASVLAASTAFAQQKYVGWSTGYLPNYANFPVSKINWAAYNVVAWFSINGDGSGNLSGLSATQAKAFTDACHQHNTKALICVGGGGAGGQFTAATKSGPLPNFINNLVTFMKSNNFDGIDIDWEDGIVASQYTALFEGLSGAFDKITPRPLLTVATFMGMASSTAPVAKYIDQVNLMSYYATMTGGDVPIPQQLAAFTSKGVPKNKLGIGYGYDTDNEVDGPNEMGNGPNGNPTDIEAKCKYTVDNGYGGIMIWEIDRAPAVCDAITVKYTDKTKSVTTRMGKPRYADFRDQGISLRVTASGGLQAIQYEMPTAGVVDLGLYDMKGNRVQNLASGARGPGKYNISLDKNQAGFSINPGAYVVKLETPQGIQADQVVLK